MSEYSEVEWSRALKYLIEVTAQKRCPKHVNELRVFNSYLISCGVKASTRYRYVQEMSYFFEFLEKKGIALSDVSMKDILEFISFKRKTVQKSSTIRKVIVILKRFARYRWEVYKEKNFKEIYETLKIPREEIPPPEVLTHEEVLKILECVGDLEYRAALAVMYECGLRLGELRSLRVKDVMPAEHGFKMRVRESKSQWRIVQVIEFQDLLRKWLEVHPQPSENSPLFPSKKNPSRPVARNTLYIVLRKAAEKAGVKKKVHPHLLRHSRATLLYKYFKEKEMMYMFGWKTRKMLDVYSHLNPDEIHKKYQALFGIKKKEEEQYKVEFKICPRCKYRNSQIAKFCAQCGFPLDQEELRKMQEEKVKEQLLYKELVQEVERMKKLYEEIKKMAQILGIDLKKLNGPKNQSVR